MTDRHPLDLPELRPLWSAVHDRLSSGRPVTRVRSGPLDDAGREALADLLGLDRLPGAEPTIPLAGLDGAVLDACGRPVRDVVTAILGPIRDRAAERELAAGRREALWGWLAGHDVVTAQPVLLEWVGHLRTNGLVDGSPDRTRSLLTAALTVLAALPAGGEPLPVLAARLLDGDSHALDDGTRLSSLVLRALAVLYGTDLPDVAEGRRALWSRAGVADDQLSSTVLAAGLRLDGDGPVARVSRICAEAGHPVSLTLAQLRTPGDFTGPAGPVHITENPSVLALALRRFGHHCPPLVCTSGWPNTAVIHLLRRLADNGASLHYHGDFDGEGIRIAAHVLAKTGAVPWRMASDDYRTAAPRVPSGPDPGRLTAAPWDQALVDSMAELRTAVVEEVVADLLLDDLANHRHG
ncbi:TIGR02679 family protein [Streptomyces sp. CB01881]|uniref:TIGR02679 family protein n=1 Tax=Streptomyces sp. CB01881 TaxID=2078691 RepID=UPI000CDC0235|nr:TIGR02679 family protein [Streptomyces sp. CB01881]AUY48289.1 TIGR02679 family protein [Streptomyces sp. CB01881]TYC76779.1 TIGR02679 family protein [Streptomyces sp. CB01881]